jgi:hypothetical protein
VHAFQAFDGFHFDHYQIFDEEVDPETTIQANASIHKWKRLLPFDAQATVSKLECQTRLASRFQHSRPDFAMDGKGRSDYPFGEGVQFVPHRNEQMQLC